MRAQVSTEENITALRLTSERLQSRTLLHYM